MIRDADTLDERLALLPHVIAVADAVAYAHDQGDRPPRSQAGQRPRRRVRRDGGHRLGPGQGPARDGPADVGEADVRRLSPREAERRRRPATPPRARWSARRRTCRPSRRRAGRSTSAPTSTRWAPSSTTCSPASRPSRRPPTRRPHADGRRRSSRSSRGCPPICSPSSTRRWPAEPAESLPVGVRARRRSQALPGRPARRRAPLFAAGARRPLRRAPPDRDRRGVRGGGGARRAGLASSSRYSAHATVAAGLSYGIIAQSSCQPRARP